MTKILVVFCNTIIRHGIYSKRWLKVLDIILEKGKGPILGKLYTIKLIETNLQLIMRIFVGSRNNENIEKDKRLSQFNYGLRRNYLINTVILEKRLIYDASMRNGKISMHTISYLKAYYDRQLLNLVYMVQKAAGVKRDAIKIIQKVMPIT